MHDDCYFYLYSECKLKERCRYRHNPLSKDNLILCKIWSKNKKCRMDCPLRHSLYHVVKQRSDTMCYWEDKGGCTKYRCEFKHVDSKKDEWKEPKIKLLTEIIESKNIHNTVGNEIGNNDDGNNEIGNNEIGNNDVGNNDVGNNDVGNNEVTINIGDSINNIGDSNNNNEMIISNYEKVTNNNSENIDVTVSDANCILVEENKISCNEQRSSNEEITAGKFTKDMSSYQGNEILDNSTVQSSKNNIIEKSTNNVLTNESVNIVADTIKVEPSSLGIDCSSLKIDSSVGGEPSSLKVESLTSIVDQSSSCHKQDIKEDIINNKRELTNSDDLPIKKIKSDSRNLDFDIDSLDKEIAELEKLLHDS